LTLGAKISPGSLIYPGSGSWLGLTPKFGPLGYPYLLRVTQIYYSKYPKEVESAKMAVIKVVGRGGFV